MSALSSLESKRVAYANVAWLSSSGIATRIIDMEDDYLVNVLRIVAGKAQVAEKYPLVQEFQKYNGIAYSNYANCLYNEYVYRKTVEAMRIENMYKTHVNHLDNFHGSRDDWNNFSTHSIYR